MELPTIHNKVKTLESRLRFGYSSFKIEHVVIDDELIGVTITSFKMPLVEQYQSMKNIEDAGFIVTGHKDEAFDFALRHKDLMRLDGFIYSDQDAWNYDDVEYYATAYKVKMEYQNAEDGRWVGMNEYGGAPDMAKVSKLACAFRVSNRPFGHNNTWLAWGEAEEAAGNYERAAKCYDHAAGCTLGHKMSARLEHAADMMRFRQSEIEREEGVKS